MNFFRFVFVALLLLSSPGLQAEEAPQDSEPPSEISQPSDLPPANEAEQDKGGSSWIPIVGYNPTYKVFFGGGFFYADSKYSLGIHGVVTFEKVYQVMTHWNHKVTPFFSYGAEFEYSKGYEPYYGEGGETQVKDQAKLYGDKILAKPRMIFPLDPFLDVGIFLDVRMRSQDRVEGPVPSPAIPNETTTGVGIFQTFDRRDNPQNPSAGFTIGTELTYVPASFSTINGLKDFFQLGGNFALYQETVAGIIAAVKLAGGISFGTPSYIWKYRLGGADYLRGYLDNRFRGQKYYLQQTELRLPLFDFLEAVGFIGFGDASDGDFTSAKMAYGIGARIGLPPDFINKIRIDFGVGRDQSGVFIDFGQAF